MFLLEENRYIHFLQRSDRYLSNQQEILLKEYSDEASNIINGSKEPMKIVVAGAFNSGKSTLINAFLKSEVMPTNVKRETVTINRLLYGSDFSIEVYFKNDKPPQKIKCDGKDDINNKLREKSNQMASEISSINVYYPDEDSLRYFTIIDTPGFDYSDVDNQKAEEILYQADVVLWLTREFYQNEHQQLTNLKETCKSSVKIIGLMNYIDVLSQEDIVDLSADIKKGVGEYLMSSSQFALNGHLRVLPLENQTCMKRVILGSSMDG